MTCCVCEKKAPSGPRDEYGAPKGWYSRSEIGVYWCSFDCLTNDSEHRSRIATFQLTDAGQVAALIEPTKEKS